jgi:L-amino acid N-acyltransferase YncA/rRNA-processing protein FCF1
MKFLLDTNIIIPAEPTELAYIEADTVLVTELLRRFSEGQQQFYIHDASIQELSRDKNQKRWEMRKLLLKKYPVLPHPPAVTNKIKAAFETETLNSHDQVDLILLSSVDADAIDYLVTSDVRLRKKAIRLGLESRVATIDEAISIVRALFPVTPMLPPAVHSRYAHDLDLEEKIFDSFRLDYPEFNEWFKKCKLQHRPVWTIEAEDGSIGGICMIKPNETPEYEGMETPILKICSFKIGENCRGYRFGELLLKAVFDYADRNQQSSIYITTFEKQSELVNLLENFGFHTLSTSGKGELILVKKLKFSKEEYESLTSLEFNVRFGPNQVKFDGVSSFIVPIMPRYHQILFPEAEAQLEFITGQYPFGNSIRKAYLCHANIRRISSGDVIFFYRSAINRGVSTCGVVENIIISSDPREIARSVGKRTVYSYPEIEELCSKGDVLIILFRLSQSVIEPVPINILLEKGVFKKAPQSIVSVSLESAKWLKKKLSR